MKISNRRRNRPRAIGLWVGFCVAMALLAGGLYLYFSQPDPKREPAVSVAEPASIEIVPATERVDSFPVMSELPARLLIDKIDVDAPIIPLGLKSDGAMDAPDSLTDVGWYDKSAKAGEDNYSVLLDGHRGINGQQAVFMHLDKMVVGDTMTLVTAEGTKLTYTVREVEARPRGGQVGMQRAMMPYEPGMQSLTIITCDGTYDEGIGTYDDRIVVYAERTA